MMAIMAFVGLLVLLPVPLVPWLTWTILGTLAAVIIAVTANLLYAFLFIEIGYYPQRRKPETRYSHPGRALEHLRTMLHHHRMLRHH